MTISYNWLKNYINCDMSVEEISKVLTDIGLEVEALEKIESIKGGLDGLKIGEVLTCEKHPDADKLNITTVEYGEGPVQIVCGAPNCKAGLKVVVATNGAVLYPTSDSEGFKIKKSKIRGVESNGMLCAEDEIGVGSDHAGIMELDANATVGQDAKSYFGIVDDYTLEIGLTPNRVDASSHIGVARDVIAYLNSQGSETSIQTPSVESFGKDAEGRAISVTVENTDAAPRYMGVTISNIKIAPSPEWLQNCLRAINITPKNNVVDITNFVLHETGHPLHAFDADKISGDKIIVKNCAEGTPFTTLDEVERKLSADDLMICNENAPMCIAGVFGGLESGVSDSTTTIFLESAYFNPVSVRKTAKRHAISTDSSFRYERGCDPQMTPYALKRAALLIKEYAGGTITSDVTDILNLELKPYDVELSIAKVNSLIGKEIGEDKIKSILKGLEINIAKEENGVLSLEVPMYRVDVRRDVDVIEDILRIYGYNNVEVPQMVHSTLSYAPKPDVNKIIERISETLSYGGFNEIMSNSLTKASYYTDCEAYDIEKCVKILNPLSNDLNVMRQTLLFNAMEALQLNTNRRNGSVKLYEIGNCYFYNEKRKEEGGLAPYRQES
ncbi:MAG: phenylalanine--tRNA ligase subunit beta, partial [Rikenellaceae bacterium]